MARSNNLIGLSSSYYGFQGKKVYDSAKRVFDLGFETVELGAGHGPEPKIWETIKRIKHDFPDKNYTLHGLFPPPKERMWFNASNGLTSENVRIVEAFFKAASIVEAEVVSIHPGFTEQLVWKKGQEPMSQPLSQNKIDVEKAWPKFYQVMEKCLALADDVGCVFAIENIPKIAIPLVYSVQDFENVFQKFPGLGLLLDVGHALYDRLLPQFLEAHSSKVAQVHMHFSRPEGEAAKTDEHEPITSLEQIEPLRAVKQFNKIPVIFEHSTNISEKQILAEKKLVEGFGKKNFPDVLASEKSLAKDWLSKQEEEAWKYL